MDIFSDNRIVMTLDAGGTNFVFTAIQGGKVITSEIVLPSNGHDLEKCLQTIKGGFHIIKEEIVEKPAAISFAFPGPSDYPNGIIGDLYNLPGFRGGVPLGAILEAEFKLPVFINNDGDLYAYGEALGGILPEINQNLQAAGSPRRYRNLAGLTLGTGFGGGLVNDFKLWIGDNAIAAEVWLFSNRLNTRVNAEELISTRAIRNNYTKLAGVNPDPSLMPRDIAEIALSQKEGNAEAARTAFGEFGKALGDTVANLLTLIDGIVVIGGGITGASSLYMPAMMEELNSSFEQAGGSNIPRLAQKIFNLNDETQQREFYRDHSIEIIVKETGKKLYYDPSPRLAVVTSRIGASKAIALGAYAFALSKITE
jgi:glucokinase